jgi:hypothetical protein
MPNFSVPITYSIDGYITVEAFDENEAIAKAKNEFRIRRDSGLSALDCIDLARVEIDFAQGEEPESVEECDEDSIP